MPLEREGSFVRVRFVGKRCLQLFIGAFAVLTSVCLFRGQALKGAMKDAALWSLLSAAIFAGAVVYYDQKNKPCDLCRDGDSKP